MVTFYFQIRLKIGRALHAWAQLFWSFSLSWLLKASHCRDNEQCFKFHYPDGWALEVSGLFGGGWRLRCRLYLARDSEGSFLVRLELCWSWICIWPKPNSHSKNIYYLCGWVIVSFDNLRSHIQISLILSISSAWVERFCVKLGHYRNIINC